jgi:hypothetical protein
VGVRRTCSWVGILRVLGGGSFRGGDGIAAPAPATNSNLMLAGDNVCSPVILSPSSIPPDLLAFWYIGRKRHLLLIFIFHPTLGIVRKSHVTHRTSTSTQYPRTHIPQRSSYVPNPRYRTQVANRTLFTQHRCPLNFLACTCRSARLMRPTVQVDPRHVWHTQRQSTAAPSPNGRWFPS